MFFYFYTSESINAKARNSTTSGFYKIFKNYFNISLVVMELPAD